MLVVSFCVLALIIDLLPHSVALPTDPNAGWPSKHVKFEVKEEPYDAAYDSLYSHWPPYAQQYGGGDVSLSYDNQVYENEDYAGESSHVKQESEDVEIQPSLLQLTMGENDDAILAPQPISQSQKQRLREARGIFLIMAEKMGCELGLNTLKSRFKDYALSNILNDLLSGDDEKVRLATASIIMHRTSQSLAYNRRGNQDVFPDGLVWGHFTKEEILNRIYQVMRVAPAEDVRQWWYSRIMANQKRGNIFLSLFSESRNHQIQAIHDLSGLYYYKGFWLKASPYGRNGVKNPGYGIWVREDGTDFD